MSIFRDTFQPEIKQSLEFRQNAMTNRTPQVIQYMNSRNSWIRMTSAVNVDGSSTLASQYILQGGTLNSNKTPKSGIGSNTSNAYSTVSPSGAPYRLGIRPMPGINSLNVKSKSAYGSLREATIKFQCWDIKQLEDLEILYMRPGYTVLVEWGWVPYFDEKETYQSIFTDFYSNKILNPKTDDDYNITNILNTLYKKSIKAGGNYDALYGYIKNYEWSAREDGGYDCSTTIISIGEMAESLKLNYIRADLDKLYKEGSVGIGLLDELFENQGTNKSILFTDYYQKNTLAGIWAELALKLEDPSIKAEQILLTGWAVIDFPGLKNYGDLNKFIKPGSSKKTYITLNTAFNIINKFALIYAKPSNVPLVKLSTKTETYSGKDEEDLLCVAHPLQVSVDPTVCLIENSLWYEEIVPSITDISAAIIEIPAAGSSTTPATGSSNTPATGSTVTTFSVNDAIASIQILKQLKENFFYEDNPSKELGVISNIYVSLDFLYRQSLSQGLESGDSKEKDEIDLFKYIKSIASGIQTAIGNINNFEIHVDPIDNTARIVDINYAVPTTPSNLFTLKIQNTNSIVRSYKMQSQIFPNQSSLITMGSQPRRGIQGNQNNTLVDFNTGLIDRIVKDKEDPKKSPLFQNKVEEPNLAYNVANIITLFGILGKQPPEGGATNNIDIGGLANKTKNSLRDTIIYFQSLSNIESPGRNRGILPLKYSFTIDGIGGLVIGSLFKVEDEFIPKGYKGKENIGTDLVQTISGINHEISNGDWKTTIEALNAIITRPSEGDFDTYKTDISTHIKEAIEAIVSTGEGTSST